MREIRTYGLKRAEAVVSLPLRYSTLVALTGWGQEDDVRLAREAGFDHHLLKPVDLNRLMDTLRQAPRRG
jgi:CheY-like chemotaxis protein